VTYAFIRRHRGLFKVARLYAGLGLTLRRLASSATIVTVG
jgi:hypothetical protein